ncbi:MAG: hypothetical protein H7838_11755, partial [Magnetococcus sp. DMHC-8]
MAESDTAPGPRRRPARAQQVEPAWSRRRFLVETGITAGLATGMGMLGYWAYSTEAVRTRRQEILTLRDFRVDATALHPDLVVVRGTAVEAMVREAVTVLG